MAARPGPPTATPGRAGSRLSLGEHASPVRRSRGAGLVRRALPARAIRRAGPRTPRPDFGDRRGPVGRPPSSPIRRRHEPVYIRAAGSPGPDHDPPLGAGHLTFLRSALFNVFFFGSTVVLTLPAWVVSFGAPHRALAWARLWARVQIGAAGIICGIRMEVQGRENLPSGAALIASRHESAFDILAWIVLVPECCFVVKRELGRIPLFGSLIERAGMILVDRAAGTAAMRTLLRGGDRAKAEGRQIVIFPEGTRVDPAAHPPLQPGVAALAARTGLPVVPVATDSGRCWGKRAFRKRAGTIHIRIAPPLPAATGRDAVLSALHLAYGG
jgi:1-acyl-sn-glycerol-3-phosphate acyltransferase